MAIPAIAHEIKDIRGDTSEGHVNGVWDSILNWVFPSSESYITRPQDKMTKWGGRKGFSDLHTFEWDETNDKRIFFLITQCKPQKQEGQDKAWEDAAEQLGTYLWMQHGKRPVRNRPDVYGIVAVGRRVRFFRYSDANQNVVPFRPGLMQSTKQKREYFDLVNDAGHVMAALRWIRRHHS